MVFSSVTFLFRFLPIFFVSYFLVKPKYRNIVLLVGSLFFYAVGEPIYIILMIVSILINHVISLRIFEYCNLERSGKRSYTKKKRQWLSTALIYNFAVLFIFKYMNFFTGVINDIIGSNVIPEVSLTLPLGISFYTFQMASYIIDVYRDQIKVEHSIIPFATYVSMFPQLIAGPIVNYKEVEENLRERMVKSAEIEWGVTIFILGLTYKVLLANPIGGLWNSVQTVGAYGINAPVAWLGSWGYSMQIFFDFFGYSLMAIGLGCIMGFHLPMNFKSPYCAKSATEFWRRWHITLGRWFREYVYIPLGGNRKGKIRQIFNLFIVWALTGLWHGANWNFILWGVMFFAILVFEKLVLRGLLDKTKVAGHIYMFILIPISWTIFNITDMSTLLPYLATMFGIPLKGTVVIHGMERFFRYLGQYWWLLLICAFCCTPLPMRIMKRYYKSLVLKVIMVILFWLCVYQLVTGVNNPFLYFRF